MNDKEIHLIVHVDLTDFTDVENKITDTIKTIGKINGLINCAGISTTLPFNMVKPKKMDEFFHANVHSAFNLTRITTKQSGISESGASIVFISSVMGLSGESGKSLYSMTKGALIAGSRSLAIELAPKKIRVNCISPELWKRQCQKVLFIARMKLH
jgi:NAD(P)-dependent dehydrogenase (short-subunit alcohol dehydrogenase family)